MKQLTTAALALIILAVCANPAAAYYGDPPDDRHPWAVHDQNRPRPEVVTPGEKPGDPPSDAIVLFNGTDLSMWEADKPGHEPTKWKIVDGTLESVKGAGYIRTRDQYGDCQLHIEFATPSRVEGDSQGRGNSGIFFHGLYEIQVLDSYNNDTYPDGQCSAVYGQHPPIVNNTRGPGEWQVYDIVFRSPKFKDGKCVEDGYVTVFLNGAVVQDHWILEGPTGHMGRTSLRPHPEKGNFKIQDHGNPVHFRNIWIRELPPRDFANLGISDNKDEVMAKRAEIADKVLKEAMAMSDDDPRAKIHAIADGIQYRVTPKEVEKVASLATAWLAKAEKVEDKEKVKGDARGLQGLFRSLMRFEILPKDFAPAGELNAFIKKYNLDK